MGFNTSEIFGILAGIIICSFVTGLLVLATHRLCSALSLHAAMLLLGVPAPAGLALWGSMRSMRGSGFGDWIAAWHRADVVGMALIAGASILFAWLMLRRYQPKFRPEIFG